MYKTEGNPHSHAKGLTVHSLQPMCPAQDLPKLPFQINVKKI